MSAVARARRPPSRARLRAVQAVLDEQGRPLNSFKVQVEAVAPPVAVYELDRMLTLVTTHMAPDAMPSRTCLVARSSPVRPAPRPIPAIDGSPASRAATSRSCGWATIH